MTMTSMRVRHGEVELYTEVLGEDDEAPTLLLVNGFTSQLTSWTDPFCHAFVDRGFRVVRFDNRDCGLSTHLPEGAQYTLSDMAADALAVASAAGSLPCHVLGISMGGMIVQVMAAEHPELVASMTSYASSTGNPDVGAPTDGAMAALMAPPATTRAEHIQNWLAGKRIWGTDGTWDDASESVIAGAAWDRSPPAGGGERQMAAIVAAGNRDDAVATISCPTLVIHGTADTLIGPEAGVHTAGLIESATHLEIEGMGHDIPMNQWAAIVDSVTRLAASAVVQP